MSYYFMSFDGAVMTCVDNSPVSEVTKGLVALLLQELSNEENQ